MDSTSKIGKRDPLATETDVVTLLKNQALKNKKANGSATPASTDVNSSSEDQVNLSVSQEIQDAIDPSVLLDERKKKVAALKQQVEAGTYQVSSTKTAEAVAQELAQEIYFADPAPKDGTDSGLL